MLRRSASPLFGEASPSDLLELAGHFAFYEVASGQQLQAAGAAPACFSILVAGTVAMSRTAADGADSAWTLTEASASPFLGEEVVLAGYSPAAPVRWGRRPSRPIPARFLADFATTVPRLRIHPACARVGARHRHRSGDVLPALFARGGGACGGRAQPGPSTYATQTQRARAAGQSRRSPRPRSGGAVGVGARGAAAM